MYAAGARPSPPQSPFRGAPGLFLCSTRKAPPVAASATCVTVPSRSVPSTLMCPTPAAASCLSCAAKAVNEPGSGPASAVASAVADVAGVVSNGTGTGTDGDLLVADGDITAAHSSYIFTVVGMATEFLSAGDDCVIRRWPAVGPLVPTQEIQCPSPVLAMAPLSSDGTATGIVAGFEDATASVWCFDTSRAASEATIADFKAAPVQRISPADGCLPNTLNLRFNGVDSEALMASAPTICCSPGSACSHATPKPSHVLMAMGLDREAAGECLRFSLSQTTSAEDIDQAVELLVEAVGYVRSVLEEAA